MSGIGGVASTEAKTARTLLKAANGWEDPSAFGWDGTLAEDLFAGLAQDPTAYGQGYQAGLWGSAIAGGLSIIRCPPALVRSGGATS